MKTLFRAAGLGGLMALSLAACNQAAPPPSAAMVNVTPSSFRMPAGTGCAGEIDRFRAVLGNDLSMGHVNRPVYDHAAKDVDRASAACSAGRDAEAMRMVHATKARYGYR